MGKTTRTSCRTNATFPILQREGRDTERKEISDRHVAGDIRRSRRGHQRIEHERAENSQLDRIQDTGITEGAYVIPGTGTT